MTFLLDPVWPWSRLWEVLLGVTPGIRFIAAVAFLASLLMPLALLARARRSFLWAIASTLAVALLLVSRHTWPLVLANLRGTHGSGFYSFGLSILSQLALILLLVAPGALVGVSVGTYVGTPGMTRTRLGVTITLRLLAFLLALVAIARPALGWLDEIQTRSQLFILLDRSRSMTVQDERGKVGRWDYLLRHLKSADTALARLRDEQQVEVRIHTFADDLQEFDLEQPGEPTGKRTDVGGALRALFDRRDPALRMRGCLVVSDGADNGGVPALSEAMRWRGLGGQVHTFACGNPGTTPRQNDVSITAISTSPAPFVPVKGKMSVKLTIDARGYENSRARVRLFLESPEGKDVEVLAKDVTLPLTTGNEVVLRTDAPAVPGEVKIKAVVDSTEPDDLPLNNSIESFVTVSKEGISVLLVDRQRSFEPQFICDALANDARIRVTPVWVRGGKPQTPGGRLRVLDEQPFDVILLGDVTASQLRSLDPDAMAKIEKQVAGGAGLLVLGGYVNLGNGDWKGTELERILPVDLSARGQKDEPVRMVPTKDGLRLARYILRLDEDPDLEAAWGRLARLEGMTNLQLPLRRGLETVLATTERPDEPLLIYRPYGGEGGRGGAAARVLVFGGDTTYRWVRNEEGQRLHDRFWRQMVVWLARQEDAEGSVFVKPDVRRLPVKGELSFGVGLRGKGGGPDLRDGKYEVEVVSPEGAKTRVPVMATAGATRGVFPATATPGIYRITVRGEGKDPSGGVVSGEASARVIVYDEDLELARPAADPEFMKKVATAGGGEALRVEQLGEFLERLAEKPLEDSRPRMDLRPDWRTTERSGFLAGFFLAFCLVISLEWGLRRWWGLV